MQEGSYCMLFLPVIEFIITNNSGQTLIVKPSVPKMGVWEKLLESPLSSHSKTRGVVSIVHARVSQPPSI